MRRLLPLTLLLALPVGLALEGACGLPDDPGKMACRDQSDCLVGYVCQAGLCLGPGDELDLGVSDGPNGQDGGPPDLTPSVPGKLGQACGTCEANLTCEGGLCRRGAWSTRTPMPTPRHSFAAVTGPDGRLYVIGGYSSQGVAANVEAYTPSTDSWTTLAPLAQPRESLCATLGPDGKIYAIGGPYQDVSHDGQSHVVEVYDIAANQWSLAPALNTGRSDAAAVTAAGRIWVIAGNQLTTLTDLASMESLAPGESAWTNAGFSLNTGRSGFGAALLPDGRIFALGGDNNFDKLASVEFFTPGSNGWNTATALPSPRLGLAAAVGGDGRLYAIGGTCFGVGGCPSMAEMAAVEAYAPSANSWEHAASMPTARFNLAVTVTSDGRIWALGGDTSAGIVGTLEVFTP